jgi:predicted aconitase with swiveling domain
MAPLAIINAECEPITAVGCIISEIPCVDLIDIDKISNRDFLQVKSTENYGSVIL